MNLRDTIFDAASLIEPGSSPKVEHKTRGFLQELNSGGATPLEQLSPKEARDLLAALQASAPHSLPPADIEQKTVEQDGLAVSLTIVRPINVRERGPAFLFLPWRWVRAGRLFDA
jgi:hypothetical protein